MKEYSAQVLIIGGGATGAGILLDLSLRGLSVLLLEQGDLGHGTSSRFHGLLHSGARYVVNDFISASECAAENERIKKIAPAAVRDTKGWFVQLEGDSDGYLEKWLSGCQAAKIPVREVSLAEVYEKEPLLNKRLRNVFEVPDAAVDGFKMVRDLARAAESHGGRYLTYHKVETILSRNGRVEGAEGIDAMTGETFRVESSFVVNAAGAWASGIADLAKVKLEMAADKGTLLAFNQRLFGHVINRLHPPDDGDIFVPHETITIFGTTSELVDSPEDNVPFESDIKRLIEKGGEIVPDILKYRIIRAFAGVRPLYKKSSTGSFNQGEGRGFSRNFSLIDHETQDGVKGFLSIVGGKFTTYRLMAEKVSDWIADKLDNKNKSQTTREIIAPYSSELIEEGKTFMPCKASEKALYRLGGEAEAVFMAVKENPRMGRLICECEMVTAAEVSNSAKNRRTFNLGDVRRQTRLGMGTCQGAFCAYRAISLLAEEDGKFIELNEELIDFLNRRWKGIRPVLWGSQLRETELTRAIYSSVLGFAGQEG